MFTQKSEVASVTRSKIVKHTATREFLSIFADE